MMVNLVAYYLCVTGSTRCYKTWKQTFEVPHCVGLGPGVEKAPQANPADKTHGLLALPRWLIH